MSKNIKRIAIIIIVIVVFVLLVFLNWRANYRTEDNISSGIIWSNESTNTGESGNISIVGFTSMQFDNETTTQSVELYNPSSNNCYMNMEIIADDEVIWSCENLYPNYGFKEIELNKELEEGIYDAIYRVRCFDVDNDTEYNGATMNFVLYVK